MYLSYTRHDIAFSVAILSQRKHNPSKEHLEAVYWSQRHLKISPGLGLYFRRHTNCDIEVHSDTTWWEDASFRGR